MDHTLDHYNLQILQLLQHDARLTNREIAKTIGKSVSPVFERIKKLQESGYIKQFVTILDGKRMNKGLTVFTNIRLKAHARDMMLAFEHDIVRCDEVMECFHMTGEYDFLLKIAVRDMDAYHDFVLNRLSKLPNVAAVRSFFVMKEAKCQTAYPL
jgi:DNA-binding Lrp family transcriptional regulator